MSGQAAFAAALLAERAECPDGLRTWNGSDPAPRFAVYRNNVIVSLIDALADTYPATRQLVGEEFFGGMACAYARTHPPRSPVLATYGDGFAEFVAAFPAAASLPYLPDVARLEWLYVRAFHAADADPLPNDEIAALLAVPNALARTCFSLHPSLSVLRSSYAVASLWAAHQGLVSWSDVHPEMPEAVLLVRVGLEVEVLRIGCGAHAFISGLRRGEPLGVAADAALSVDTRFDPADGLGLLIRSGAIVGIQTNRSTAP